MASTGAVVLDADADFLRVLLQRPTSTVDVVFDGHRVWSFDLAGYGPDANGVREIPWPTPLRSRLDGTATVELREHPIGAPIASARLRFGSGSGSVDLTDDHGRLLSLSKWGRLNQSFSDFDPESLEWYLDKTDKVLAVLSAELGLPAFLCYGTLLGAVRSGHFIGHDMDVDVAYLSTATSPVDAMRESYSVERHLRGRGWKLRRQNGGFLQLFFEQPGGGWRNIDVFTMFVDPGIPRLYGVNDTTVDGGLDLVLPLSTVELEGRLLPAPHRAEALLAAAYGPSWRVPDPGFAYGMNPGKRQMREWFGGSREDKDRWTKLYRQQPDIVPATPTGFAAKALPHLVEADLVVDAGCGMGRDAIFYSQEVAAAVVGLDAADSGVRRSRRRAARAGSTAIFRELNFGLLRETMVTATRLSCEFPGRRTVVARHLLDAMSPAGVGGFLDFCSAISRGGGECIFQFTTTSSRSSGFEEFAGLPKLPLPVEAVADRLGERGARVDVLESFDGREGMTAIVKGAWV